MGHAITDIPGIGSSSAEILAKNGYRTVQQVGETTPEKLGAVPGFGLIRAARVIKLANALLTAPATDALAPSKTRVRPKRAAPRAAQPAVVGGAEKQEPDKPKKDKPKKGKKKDKDKDKKKDKKKQKKKDKKKQKKKGKSKKGKKK
jgi:hypothetical protein